MSANFDPIDYELLGEEYPSTELEPTTKHASTEHEAHLNHPSPLIAMAGTLTKVDRSGNEIMEDEVS